MHNSTDKKYTAKNLYILLFLIGWFFFPFNDFEGFEPLGEFKNEAGAFFFMGGLVILVLDSLHKKRLSIPFGNFIFQVLLLFFFWCIITTLLNFPTVSTNYFKHTGGIYRFIRQYVSLMIPSFLFLVFFWNVIANWSIQDVLYKTRRVLLLSFIFVSIYGFIESLVVVFHMNAFKALLAPFDYFPFLDVNYLPGERISSVAYEAPSLGNYLITVAGWMFSYIFTEKNKLRFLPTFAVLALTFFSGSRTALIIVTLQAVILFSIMYAMPEYRKVVNNMFRYGFLFVVVLLALNGKKIINAVNEKAESLNFSRNLMGSVSNQSRFGMQYASIQVFKENPIIGVGYGQETYHKRFHYPGWAKRNNWEFEIMYENNSVKSFPSAYNMYTRLLAETGLIGTLIFLFLIYLCISNASYLYRNSQGDEKILSFVLLVSFTGLSINWLQTDFFRQHGFWLCLAILIRLMSHRKALRASAMIQSEK